MRPRRESLLLQKTAFAAGILLSLSLASGFQTCPAPRSPWIPEVGRVRLSVLSAVTDPEVLLRQYQDGGDIQSVDRDRIELLYSMSTRDSLPTVPRPERKTTNKVSPKKKKKKTVRLEKSVSREDDKVQFRGLSTTAFRGKRRRTALKSALKSTEGRKRSSTMPGFAVESGRQRAYREAVRLVEKNTGKKIVDSAKARKSRKKENGEAMYRNSNSVPDSMVQFADEIHQEDRISRKEEIELGEKTQEAIRLQRLYDNLEENLARDPTDQEWCAAAGKINMEAIRQEIEEGLEAKNKLVTSNLRLVQSVVNTYIRNGLTAQYNAGDMMQEGIIALIRAAEKFEPDRGWKFSTYAMYWVRASVKRNQVSQSRVINVPHRLYENHKRLMKLENELKLQLDRRPTRKELADASDMTEQQVERCLTAIEQRCFSLDQEIKNTLKPMSNSSQRDRLVDILDTKSEDSEDRKLESMLLREDLIETLNRHLQPEEVELLLLRYGLKALPESNRIAGQPTIAELSRVVGLKPDKIRRIINRSLKHLRTAASDEWRSFQRDMR